MINNKKINLFVLTIGILFALVSEAIQLGKITVNSKQAQPFSAQIEAIVTKADDLTELVPAIASKENFEAQGIERLPIHADIQTTFVKNADGKVFLKLNSAKAVQDPFLDLLIEIQSAKGKTYREYTVLLDPADPMDKIVNESLEKENKSSELEPQKSIENGKKAEIAKQEQIDKDKTEKNADVSKKQKTKKAEKSSSEVSALKTVRSVPGKTLYQIGRENSISGVTLEQMVVGIYLNNKSAFAEGNINGLNKNQTITIPNENYFDDLSHLKARKILREQNNEWKKINNTAKVIPEKETQKNNEPAKLSNIEEVTQLQEQLKQANQKLAELKKDNENPNTKANLGESKVAKNEIDNKANKLAEDNKSANAEINEINIEDVEISNDDVFVSSITNDEAVKENVITDSNQKNSNNLLAILVLIIIIVILTAAAFIVSSKRKNKMLFTNSSPQNNNDLINQLGEDENKLNF